MVTDQVARKSNDVHNWIGTIDSCFNAQVIFFLVFRHNMSKGADEFCWKVNSVFRHFEGKLRSKFCLWKAAGRTDRQTSWNQEKIGKSWEFTKSFDYIGDKDLFSEKNLLKIWAFNVSHLKGPSAQKALSENDDLCCANECPQSFDWSITKRDFELLKELWENLTCKEWMKIAKHELH